MVDARREGPPEARAAFFPGALLVALFRRSAPEPRDYAWVHLSEVQPWSDEALAAAQVRPRTARARASFKPVHPPCAPTP